MRTLLLLFTAAAAVGSALLGLVLGPLMLVWLVVARPSVGGWATAVAIGLVVGGFVCLVLRQPGSRDDDPTNGARV